MHQSIKEAAPEAGTFESGKEPNINLSVPSSGEKVKPIEMYGYISMDEDGNAYFEGASIGAMIGERVARSGYAYVKIEVRRDAE